MLVSPAIKLTVKWRPVLKQSKSVVRNIVGQPVQAYQKLTVPEIEATLRNPAIAKTVNITTEEDQ